jgi:hypothetical protein
MHIITWINKTDSFGHIFDEADSKFWYKQTFGTPLLKDAVAKMEELKTLEANGNIINIKHIFRE